MMKTRLLSRALAAAGAVLALASQAPAQSMYPMVDEGITFSDRKAVMLTVTNPYQSAETFRLEAFEQDYATPTGGVQITPDELTLGSEASRRIRVIFEVPGKERIIAVCVQPVDEDAQVVPRVCGRYAARRAGAR